MGEVYNCINMPGDVYVLVRKKPTVNVAYGLLFTFRMYDIRLFKFVPPRKVALLSKQTSEYAVYSPTAP